MVKQLIDIGNRINDVNADSLRVGGDKINDNFTEIYNALGDGTNLLFDFENMSPVDTQAISYNSVSGNYETRGVDLVDDLTPQLGGNLDMNGLKIISNAGDDINITPHGTGRTVITNALLKGTITINLTSSGNLIKYNYPTFADFPTADSVGGQIAVDVSQGRAYFSSFGEWTELISEYSSIGDFDEIDLTTVPPIQGDTLVYNLETAKFEPVAAGGEIGAMEIVTTQFAFNSIRPSKIASGAVTARKLQTGVVQDVNLGFPTIIEITPNTILGDEEVEITIEGNNFQFFPTVEIQSDNGQTIFPANVIFDSETRIRFTVAANTLSEGQYRIRVVNPNGLGRNTVRGGLVVSPGPIFTTRAGSLGALFAGGSESFFVDGSSDSAVTFTSTGGQLPPGFTVTTQDLPPADVRSDFVTLQFTESDPTKYLINNIDAAGDLDNDASTALDIRGNYIRITDVDDIPDFIRGREDYIDNLNYRVRLRRSINTRINGSFAGTGVYKHATHELYLFHTVTQEGDPWIIMRNPEDPLITGTDLIPSRNSISTNLHNWDWWELDGTFNDVSSAYDLSINNTWNHRGKIGDNDGDIFTVTTGSTPENVFFERYLTEETGFLPPDSTTTRRGVISGTDTSGVTQVTTYTFDITMTDAEDQSAVRSFSITIQPPTSALTGGVGFNN